ncbi:YolD-like family protein [Peribacillus deserti]|uniref:Uncharacterized protein n=1 Tax=Peribacillus deserti TaxID=673318 RepID=A0A2N5M1A5_9BACI|nr:hypothetical protein CUU66_19660 [Peribacillus deserti]
MLTCSGSIKLVHFMLPRSRINNLIAESMEFTYPLHFQYYQNKRMNSLEEFVHYVDDINRQLRILDANGEIHKLSFSSIKRNKSRIDSSDLLK